MAEEKVSWLLNFGEFVKDIGPYVVAVASAFFAFKQHKKTVEIQIKAAELTSSTQLEVAKFQKEKDIEVAKFQKEKDIKIDKLRNDNSLKVRVLESQSLMFSEISTLVQNYHRIILKDSEPSEISKLLVFPIENGMSCQDLYIKHRSFHKREAVYAESSAICQMLNNPESYVLVTRLHNHVTKTLNMIDIYGNKSGEEYADFFMKSWNECVLLYNQFFYSLNDRVDDNNQD